MTTIRTDKCGQCGWQGEAHNAQEARGLLEQHLMNVHNISGKSFEQGTGISQDIPGQSQSPRLNPND